MNNELKTFVINFFKDIGSEIIENPEYIQIEKVPVSFQKFYGKNSPYKFCFEKIKDQDIEYVEKGNYLLKTINSYLENSAKTTLLKINIEDDFSLNNYLKRYTFNNSQISIRNSRKSYSFLSRFTFHSSFQYLNKKEKVIDELFIIDKEIIKGTLDNYKLEEGNTREINIPNVKEEYELAKKELNERITPRINQISKLLQRHLETQIKRIEAHIKKEKKELEENILKNEEKLNLIDKKDIDKFSRQKKLLQNLKKELEESDFEKQKEHQIKIEESRTNLNINSKLFNTTIIYHPTFIKTIEVSNEFSKSSFQIEYNPLKNEYSELKCSECKEDTNHFFLDSKGNLLCKKCLSHCESCNKIFSLSLLRRECSLCNKKICEDCSERCSKCGKIICKSHTKRESSTGKIFCSNCLKRCERCFEFKSPNSFITSKKTGVKICESCYKKEIREITTKNIFRN